MKIKTDLKNKKGQTLVEYLLITVFLTAVFSFLFGYMGIYLRNAFTAAVSMILRIYS
jgi:Flp pilus assembly pilin Flp